MSLRYAILGILEAMPMTGYELGQHFAASANWVWAAPLSQIYPQLAKMEAEGLIVGEDGVAAGRNLRRYTLNDEGMEALVDWVGESHPARPVRDPMLLQALFLELLPTDAAVGVLHRFIAAERDRVAQWCMHRTELATGRTPVIAARLSKQPGESHARTKLLKAAAFDGLVALGNARVEWAERMIEVLLEFGPDEAC